MHRWMMGLVATALMASPGLAADAQHGKQLFQACAACHGQNGKGGTLGPDLTGVVGRKAGSLDNFRYSNAMQRSNITWDEAHLRAYVANPQAAVKGNRMPFSGVKNPKDVDDVVAYLKTLK
ncbi:MAG: c-type cytochrome [Alphaproteobacteria bacterium]|nr:c-type cytochrome [Alphaproteobacteria bacterium]